MFCTKTGPTLQECWSLDFDSPPHAHPIHPDPKVTRISVYPSDYGLQRAEREARLAHVELFFNFSLCTSRMEKAVEGPLIADEMPNSSFDDDNQEAQQEALSDPGLFESCANEIACQRTTCARL